MKRIVLYLFVIFSMVSFFVYTQGFDNFIVDNEAFLLIFPFLMLPSFFIGNK
ncbi:hypothetical protein FTV88_0276 [Heliorestis convoluta]|uniref:Uncharacterized protein n=1 Tax=Heliorestis convoluta TaxID=356322 RepID=A0A5Q2N1P0_9FIRM|nr:hypothetical protein FTV88_0276 [Heliorestis convoluta]